MGKLDPVLAKPVKSDDLHLFVERRAGYPGIGHSIEIDSDKMQVDRRGIAFQLMNHPYSAKWDMAKVKLAILKSGQVILTHDGVEHPTAFMEGDQDPWSEGLPPGWTIFVSVSLKIGHGMFGYRILKNRLVAHGVHHGSGFLQRGNICGIVRAWNKFMGV